MHQKSTLEDNQSQLLSFFLNTVEIPFHGVTHVHMSQQAIPGGPYSCPVASPSAAPASSWAPSLAGRSATSPGWSATSRSSRRSSATWTPTGSLARPSTSGTRDRPGRNGSRPRRRSEEGFAKISIYSMMMNVDDSENGLNIIQKKISLLFFPPDGWVILSKRRWPILLGLTLQRGVDFGEK